MTLDRWHLIGMPSTVVQPNTIASLCVYPQQDGRCHGVVFDPGLRDVQLTELYVGNVSLLVTTGRIPTELLTERVEHFHPHSFAPGMILRADVVNLGSKPAFVAGAILTLESDPELEHMKARHADELACLQTDLHQANGRIADLIARVYAKTGEKP